MYPGTKLDVDRHVEDCLRKINNETERNLRCFGFAKQYFQVERYEDARRYVSTYLSAKPNASEAHYLLGRCLEKLGKKDDAIRAYSTSLRLDPKNNNLVLKICELLAADDVDLDQSGAKHFCEMAQSIDPHNPAVFSLKQKLITSQSDDPKDVSDLLLKELEARPTDVKLRVRLLKHLLHHNMIKEAYKHAADVESKDLPIFHNYNWYETVAEILVKSQKNMPMNLELGWEFWFLSVSIFDRLAALSLDEHSDTNVRISSEYVGAVFNFDQTLAKAAQNLDTCPDRLLVEQFLTHYRAQLCFHFATLVFKQASKGLIKYKEAANVSLPLLFAARQPQLPDLQSIWFNHAPENRRLLIRRWRKEGAFRSSQTGRVLLSQAKNRKSILLSKAAQYSTGMWREQIFKKIFITRDQQLKMSTSYFLTNHELHEITIRLPDKVELSKIDEEAQLLYPNSLHHLIWIVLNNKLSEWNLKVFDGLQYSIKQLKNCGAETLNLLDLHAFVSAATICARASLESSRNLTFYNADKPPILPASITQELGTLNQNAFFKAAYKMYCNEYDSGMDQIRLILVEGIKIIRCVDHGLDVHLLVSLANTFSERAKILTKQSEIDFNEARAELYWKAALPLLEKLKNDQIISYAPNKLFNFKSKDMAMSEILSHIETGKLFSGCQLFKKKEYEKALSVFEHLKDPYASFYQAQIYKSMADLQMGQNRENVTSEMRSQNIILLTKARDCFYLTLDRLREPRVDQKHPLNTQLGTEIEKIERSLSRIDPDCNNRNECDGMSDENVSSADGNSTADHYVTSYPTQNATYLNGTFTPNRNHSTPFNRREARPSPERLDAQLRQLAASKDAAITQILESQRTLVEELRSFKDIVHNTTSTIEHLKKSSAHNDDLNEVKKSINELKESIEELDNFKTITDMLHEMKKEIADLKKDVNKSSQLSEEDIYGLTNDYATDYSAYNSNLFTNYQGRAAAAAVAAVATAPPGSLYGAANPLGFPGLYHPTMAYYGGLGLSQVPGMAPPPPPDQLASDFRAISAAFSSQPSFVPNPQLPVVSQPLGLFSTPPAAPKVAPVIAATLATRVLPSPPVNVVITTSDPLPAMTLTTAQPVLSVTIPPQHLKGKIQQPQRQPHNYQIPLPPSAVTSTSPSVLSQPPPAVPTQSLLMNVAPPVYSALASPKVPTSNVTLGLQIEKSLDRSFNASNVSATSSVDEHDPCPDFKPIVPLPDEVPVNTGEESEIVLFSERAKLFRFTGNEWKERGVGVLKILKNPESGKVRLVMRRDQIHKICANHFLTADLKLTSKDDRAFMWAAHDFADESVVVEKLCARFKSSEEAGRFKEAFEKAQKDLNHVETVMKSKEPEVLTPKPKETMSGFVFSTTPIMKSKDLAITPTIQKDPPQKSSPFAGFTFSPATAASKTPQIDFKPVVAKPSDDNDDKQDDFVPTAEFKPVVPLPELVPVKTGEENCDVLFENRAKLLRFDTSGDTKEWKERGTGIMKILKDNESGTIRLLMRRDQVHKVCCNHQLMKSMNFSALTNNPKAVTWCAKDFSEGVIRPETFAIRFKNEALAAEFLKTIKSNQELLDEENCLSSSNKHMKSEPKSSTSSTQQGFGDKFKPLKGSWECKNCYIVNDGKANYCMACETPKCGDMPKKNSDSSSGVAFSFGVASPPAAPPTSSWGTSFKPKEGSWECKACYIRNDGAVTVCVSCDTPKDGSIPAKKSQDQGVNLDTGGLKFNFGMPAIQVVGASGWGDSFKPKAGTWECGSCLVRNNADVIQCLSCGTAKEGVTVARNPEEPKFKFGLPTPAPATQVESQATFTFGQTTITALPKFSFGKTTDSGFKFEPSSSVLKSATTTSVVTVPTLPIPADKFVFGSPQKHDFEFTPKSPGRRISTGQKDDESDCSYVEEEGDNIYFKPVVPLPDKVEVKTGEEDEDVLYCHRAKLFRFAGGEWKERGLGDLKILRQKSTGKLRVLMRREQIFKICLNHALTADINYLPKDEKTWLFCAPDYSEGAIANDQFCIRFKSADVAQGFLKAVKDALDSDKTNQDDGVVETHIESSASDDVEVIWETPVSAEEEAEALRLCLPRKFMAYRQLPDCTCEQCKKDDLYYTKDTQLKPDMSSTAKSAGENTLKGLLAKPSLLGAANSSSIFGTSPSFSAKSGGTPHNTPTSGSDVKSTFSFKPSSDSKLYAKSTTFASATATTTSGGSLFGNKLFLTPNTKNCDYGSIFGSAKSIYTTPTSSSPSIFDGTTFGQAKSDVANHTTATTPLFATPTTTSSIFGAPSGTGTTTGSIFGTPKLFGTSSNSASMTGSIFGSPSTGATATAGSIFGGTFTLFGASSTTTTTTTSNSFSKDDVPILDSPSGISFASLAAKVNLNAPPAFAATEDNKQDDVSASPFAFLGAGAPVFGSKDKNKPTNDNGGNDDGTTADDEYDPHYEPIVPLPDAIVVSTGEEDETAIFNERAKLYRYDANTKEWKERGVGQMKILFHPVNKTYRFLLRREQVHKVVLNQLISGDLDVQPMTSSDKAWVWAGHNHLDEGVELEKLAVRFKNYELAQQFYDRVQEVMVAVKKIQGEKVTQSPDAKLIPSSIQNYGHEDVSSSDNEHHGEDEDEDDDEDDEDDEDDRSIMFSKRCTLYEEGSGSWQTVTMGDLCVYYDPDYYAERICVNNDTGLVVSNTIIGMNTVMEIVDNSCIWKSVEWADDNPRWRKLKATFSSNSAAAEFHSTYHEGLNYAQEFDVVDELPGEHHDEEYHDEE